MKKFNKIFMGLVVSSLVVVSGNAWEIASPTITSPDLTYSTDTTAFDSLTYDFDNPIPDTTVSTSTTCTVKGPNGGVFPISKDDSGKSHCGTKSEKEALSDGVGAIIVGVKNEDKIDNSEFNKLALKYADKADKAGVSLFDFIQYGDTAEATEEEKEIVSKLKLDVMQ